MIHIIIVNYNNSIFSIGCVKSIEKSFANYKIHIVDNNSTANDRSKLETLRGIPDVYIYLLDKNMGYFPALNYGFQQIKSELTPNDYVIIGNNDLDFSVDFYTRLNKKKYPETVFVVSPDIVNCDDNHQNPAVRIKYSRLQLLYLDLYHFHYVCACLINFVSRFVKFKGSQKSKEGWKEPGFISIGYGACYVLTPHYWEKINEIPHYLFLMNEENSLSDIVFKHDGRIYYDPDLVVNHMEHSSVSIAPKKTIYRICQKSYKESKKHFDNSKLYDKYIVKEK